VVTGFQKQFYVFFNKTLCTSFGINITGFMIAWASKKVKFEIWYLSILAINLFDLWKTALLVLLKEWSVKFLNTRLVLSPFQDAQLTTLLARCKTWSFNCPYDFTLELFMTYFGTLKVYALKPTWSDGHVEKSSKQRERWHQQAYHNKNRQEMDKLRKLNIYDDWAGFLGVLIKKLENNKNELDPRRDA